jgi:hypothetical protein
MIDSAATPQERDHRSLRLTKGPLEFRDDRIDQPKTDEIKTIPQAGWKPTKPVQAY